MVRNRSGRSRSMTRNTVVRPSITRPSSRPAVRVVPATVKPSSTAAASRPITPEPTALVTRYAGTCQCQGTLCWAL